MATAREVGVSRTAGRNSSRGYKTYRHGQVTGFVSVLERLAVREVSARYVSQDERIEIADLRLAGLSIQQIADQLGRAPSTISRELRRNAAATGYGSFGAHRRATAGRACSTGGGSRPTASCGSWSPSSWPQHWSPQQISRQLRLRFPSWPAMLLRHESIYQAVYQPGSPLQGPSPLAPHHRPRCAPGEITAVRISAPSGAGPVRAAHAHRLPVAFPT